VIYQVDYSGADTITLSANDVFLHTTGTASARVEVSGSGALIRTVKLAQISGMGTLAISIAAGTASDAAGNQAQPQDQARHTR